MWVHESPEDRESFAASRRRPSSRGFFWGYLEVPDVHQVQQGLQDVPRDPDGVRREVRRGPGCEQRAPGSWWR